MANDVDVAVIGLGVFGSAAAWRIASRGISVVGLEKYTAPNPYGSSHGRTRLFRSISQNHVDLYPLASMSRDLWIELGELSGEDLYDQTGGLVIGPADGDLISNAERVLHTHSVAAERLTAGALREEFPEFETVSDKDVAYFDPKGGILRTERCVTQLGTAARAAGAVLHEGVEVFGYDKVPQGVLLRTSIGELTAKRVVFATGVWTARFLPELRLQPVRIPQCWFTSAWPGHSPPDLHRLPPFQRELGGRGSIWGHGALSPEGLAKIGTHGNPQVDRRVDPERIDRTVHEGDLGFLRELVSTAFPALNPSPTDADICLLTESLDGQFAVGEVGDERVLVASGGSGQGFKHATGVGEIVADICEGVPSRVDTAFIDPMRVSS